MDKVVSRYFSSIVLMYLISSSTSSTYIVTDFVGQYYDVACIVA